MSLEYACVYHEKGLCRKYEEPGYVNYCAFGPCEDETPSKGDRIRRMDDPDLARYLYGLANKDFDLEFCQNRRECSGRKVPGVFDGISANACGGRIRQWLRENFSGRIFRIKIGY